MVNAAFLPCSMPLLDYLSIFNDNIEYSKREILCCMFFTRCFLENEFLKAARVAVNGCRFAQHGGQCLDRTFYGAISAVASGAGHGGSMTRGGKSLSTATAPA